MKIAIASDLHMRHGFPCPIEEEADVLILAGDIFQAPRSILDALVFENFLSDVCSRYEHVLYAYGNHEFYGFSIAEAKEFWVDRYFAKYDNFHVLDKDEITINGQHFVGATLWTDLDGLNPLTVRAAHDCMADYRWIKDFYPQNGVHLFDAESTYIFSKMRKGSIIITHHSPSYKSCHERWAGSQTNGAFHNSLEWFMGVRGREPKFWVHGHTHDKCSYLINKTRVICNPRGYAGENDTIYKPSIIEV